MADEPQEPLRRAAGSLIDLYQAVVEEEGVADIRDRLQRIQERLWYGAPERQEKACLALELDNSREQGVRARDETGAAAPDLLVLTLGYSPEPLLLSIAHHAPRRVVLLKSASLKGDYLEHFEKLWNVYQGQLGQPRFAEAKREMW
ncbi:MAG: hypothetical protein ACRDHY_18185, partial [Anaerolineales bacterium]